MYKYYLLAVYWVEAIDDGMYPSEYVSHPDEMSTKYRLMFPMQGKEYATANIRYTTTRATFTPLSDPDNPRLAWKVTAEIMYDSGLMEPPKHVFPTQISFGGMGANLLQIEYLDLSYIDNMSKMFYNCGGFNGFDLRDGAQFGIPGTVTDTSYMFYNCYKIRSYGVFHEDNVWLDMSLWNVDTRHVSNMRGMFYGLRSVQHLKLPDPFQTVSVVDMAEMFYGLDNCREIIFPGEFNTSNVRDMSRMFCAYYAEHGIFDNSTSALVRLNLEQFDTSKVTNMSNMFTGLSSLIELTISNFDTSNVESIKNIFTGCESLESLDIRGFDLSAIDSLNGIFDGCSSLKGLVMNNVNASSVTDLGSFLKGCVSLQDLYMRDFNAPNVTNVSRIFEDLSMLENIDLEWLNWENITDTSYMFKGCESLASIDLHDKNLSNITDMSYMFAGCTNLTTVNLTNTRNDSAIYMQHMFDGCNNLRAIDGLDGFYNSKVEDISYIFNDCHSLEEICFWYIYRDDLISLENVFAGCSSVRSLDLQTWMPQHKVETTKNMFQGCTNLEEILMSGLDSAKLKDTSYMFAGCSGLNRFSIVEMRTDEVVNMEHMFDGCHNLTELLSIRQQIELPLIENMCMDNVENMAYMFKDCRSMESIYFRNTEAYNIKNMDYAFAGCSSAVTIYLNIKDTSKIETMESTFEDCSALYHMSVKLDDVSNIKNTARMFKGCSSLPSIDLSDYPWSSIETMESMFEGCENIKYIIVDNDTYATADSFTRLTNIRNMFKDCSSLLELYFNHLYIKNMTSNDMSGIFEGCNDVEVIQFDDMAYGAPDKFINLLNDMRDNLPSLKTLSIHRAEGEGLTSCYQLFKGFSNLEVLNLGIDGSKITNTAEMFMGCSKLREIGISGFTQGVAPIRNASSMFEGCSSLTYLDIDSFNTRYLASANKMFKGCSSLTDLIFADNSPEYENFGFLAVANEMFSGCTSLLRLEIPNFNVKRIGATTSSINEYMSDMTDMFYDCTHLKTVVLDDFKIDNSAGLDPGDDITTITRVGDKRFEIFFKTLNAGAPNIKELSLRNFDNFYLTSMKGMFKDFKKVVEIDLTNCNTSRITDMSEMFRGCGKLDKLDLSSFDTSNVTTMESMFRDTGTLTTFDISSFNFTNVTTLANLFYGSGITYIDLANFDTTGNVTNMSTMFAGCVNLTNLYNLDKLNTSSSTNMQMMFYNCVKLEAINLSNFITSNVTNMTSMFAHCESLKNIDVSSFDATKVTTLRSMFDGCESIVELDLSNFIPINNTYSGVTMDSMFYGCKKLKRVDLSGINKKSFKYASNAWSNYTFDGCYDLEYIDLSNFDTYYANVQSAQMFAGVGKNVTVLNIGMLYSSADVCSQMASVIIKKCSDNLQRINIYVLDADPAECSCDDPRVRFIKYEREEKTMELPVIIPSGRKLQWDEERREYYSVNQYGTKAPTGVKEKIKMETYDTTMFVNFHDLQGDGKIQIAMKEKIEEESEE